MAFLTLDADKLRHNFETLTELFKKHDIQLAVVSKMLCGDETFLEELVSLNPKQLCDSRASNLKMVKELASHIETIYIKPPPKRSIPDVVRYADISVNTEFETIRLLSEEAGRQGKVHKVMIMIEMGELREGVMREEFMGFYESIFELPHIEVVGIGTNLTCMNGVLPSQDKLIQLSLYEQLIEAKFNRHIPYVSGGSSVTIPLIFQGLLPQGINHFRVGETLYQGTDVYNSRPYETLHNDVFCLKAEIIELNEKPIVPSGEMGQNLEGEVKKFNPKDYGQTTFRAILDLGLLDVEQEHIWPLDESVNFSGASSDMIVVDLGTNEKGYKVGDLLEFGLDYMGTLRVMNSRYIEKRVKRKAHSKTPNTPQAKPGETPQVSEASA